MQTGGAFHLERAVAKETKKNQVFLGIPYYLHVEGKAVSCWDRALDPNGPSRVIRALGQNAFLGWNFNSLWCMALNQKPRPTHFAMIHVDVVALTRYWLDAMIEEMARTRTDLLSVVLPIKDERGMTSTCVESKDGYFRRLSMKEVSKLPVSFDAATAGFPDRKLLASTGLWIADFRKPWVEKVHFEVRDRIVRDANGTFIADCLPEDWSFSQQLHRLGCRIMATRCVKATHEGATSYPNYQPWGTMEQDEEVQPNPWE